MKLKSNRISATLAAVSMCCFTVGAAMLYSTASKAVCISNDYLKLTVQDDEQKSAYGSFMLSKNSENQTDTLTYPQFYTSFAEVNINGSVKLYSEGKTVRKPYTDSEGAIVMVQDFDGIEITQRLSFATGNTSNYDMLQAAYTVKNNTSSNIKLSVRTIIDPTISDSDNDLIMADGTVFTQEKNFYGNDVPEEWFLKNSAGEITAYGITSDGSAAPDSFDIADWSNLYNARFDYTASDAISDNAAAVTWCDRTVKSGENFSCGTKYGLYSEKSDKTKNNSPKTGDKIPIAFWGAGICSLTAAVLCRKKRSDNDE